MAEITEHTARPTPMADPARPMMTGGRMGNEEVSLGTGKSMNSPTGGTGGHGPSGQGPPGQSGGK